MTSPALNPGRGVRLVLLAGVTLGTFAVATAVWNGARPRVGSLPGIAGEAAGTVVLWLAAVAVAVVAVAVVRACWRPAARLAWHHGRRGAAGGQAGGSRGGPVRPGPGRRGGPGRGRVGRAAVAGPVPPGCCRCYRRRHRGPGPGRRGRPGGDRARADPGAGAAAE